MQLHLHVENLSARLEDAQAAAQRLQSALATEASNAKVGSRTSLLLHGHPSEGRLLTCCPAALQQRSVAKGLQQSRVWDEAQEGLCETIMRPWLAGCERAGGGC